MNPWTASFEEHRQNILGEAKKKSDKKSSERWQDDDCDGKWYEKSDVDGKISDREKKEKKKHYKENKDCCKKCGSYEHTTKECTIKEGIEDIIARLEKKRISKGGDPDKSPLGKKTGRAMKAQQDKVRKKTKKKVKSEEVEVNHIDGSTTQIVDIIKAPKMVAAPRLSNWKEEMHWDEALKPEPLKIKEGGVKNKIQINPEVKTEGVLSDVGKKKKKESKKHEYPAGASGGDAGAKAKKKMKNKERHKYVNDIRDFDEEITLTRGDYGSRNVKGSAWNTAASKGFKGYKAGGGLTSQFKLADSYEIDEKKKLAITSPLIDRVSNWSKTKIKESAIQQAATSLATKSVENKKKAVGALTKTTEEVVDEGAGEWVQKKLTQVDSAVTKAANTKVGKPIAGALKTIFGPSRSGDGGSNRKSATKATHGKTWEHHERDADGKEIPHDVTEAKVDAGKKPEEKEAARNKRKFGTSHNQASTGALRRSLHKIKRGDKKTKGEKNDWREEVSLDEKKIKWSVKGGKKDVKDMSKDVGKAKVDYRMLAQSYTPEITVNGTALDERLGGKGYSKKATKGGGDWPDSDRGEGNKAKRRSGGKVVAKSPTYLAHVKNKKKVKSEEVVLEADSLSGQVSRWEAARQKRMKQRQSYERPHWIPRDQDHEDNWGSSKGEKKKKPQKKVKEEIEQIDEKNKYAKVTGKNLKHNKVQPKGGTAKGDSAFKAVVAQIKKKHGRAALLGGEGQNKKKKGEKGRKQVGDRKGTPADTIARRRQSKADADAAMRDTKGT